jgi:hypothetical protein
MGRNLAESKLLIAARKKDFKVLGQRLAKISPER